jgi:hypothetical protein
MSYKTVVATRAGYHDARRIYPGTVFQVPAKLKGSWFKDHKPGAPIPVEQIREPDPYTAQAPQVGQPARQPATLSEMHPPPEVPLA